MYDTGNRSNTRRFCACFDTACNDSAQPPIYHKPIPHVPDSRQPVSTHHFFNTTHFYTSVFLHKAGPAPPFPVSAHEYISGRLSKILCPPYWVRYFEFRKSDVKFVISDLKNLGVQSYVKIFGFPKYYVRHIGSAILNSENPMLNS